MKIRSIGAVLAGLLAIVVLSSAVDLILHATGVMPPWGQRMSNALFALASGYRIVISIGGCWLAARLAPSRPMAHALALGVVGVIISAIGVIVAVVKGPALGPLWYPLALVAVAMPCAWLGGRWTTRSA
jgi:hypothetical protein